jgi:hypothetical protein
LAGCFGWLGKYHNGICDICLELFLLIVVFLGWRKFADLRDASQFFSTFVLSDFFIECISMSMVIVRKAIDAVIFVSLRMRWCVFFGFGWDFSTMVGFLLVIVGVAVCESFVVFGFAVVFAARFAKSVGCYVA